MHFFPLHKQALAKYPSPARALLTVMLCVREQPVSHASFMRYPQNAREAPFLWLNKQREGSLPLTSASARGRITRAQPWAAAGEQVAAWPQPRCWALLPACPAYFQDSDSVVCD